MEDQAQVITPTPVKTDFFAPASVAPVPAVQAGTQAVAVSASQISVSQLLSPEDRATIEEQVPDLKVLSMRDIALFHSDVDQGLNNALNGFLDRINHADAPRLFNLVSTFNEQVSKEDLPGLAAKVLDDKLPLKDRIIGFFSKKKLAKLKNDFLESTRVLISGKSGTLTNVINKMEVELRNEQVNLENELKIMSKLRETYFTNYKQFVGATYQGQLALSAAQAVDTSTWNVSDKREWEEKLQAMESRVLAMEGVLTRLPADALVVSQLQNAGIITLQETTTTAATRFASIKMTLITLNSTLAIRSVQQLSQQSADLDNNLLAVRSKLMQQVVTDSAMAPGKNRLMQAEQIKQIVADTTELMKIVDDAKATNKASFEEARKVFGEARRNIADLGARTSTVKSN
jgi:hypothetical protein